MLFSKTQGAAWKNLGSVYAPATRGRPDMETANKESKAGFVAATLLLIAKLLVHTLGTGIP